VTFDRMELQGKLLALKVAIASGERVLACALVAELLRIVADVASSADHDGN